MSKLTPLMVKALKAAAADPFGVVVIPGRKWRLGKSMRERGLLRVRRDYPQQNCGLMVITDAGREALRAALEVAK